MKKERFYFVNNHRPPQIPAGCDFVISMNIILNNDYDRYHYHSHHYCVVYIAGYLFSAVVDMVVVVVVVVAVVVVVVVEASKQNRNHFS